MKILIAEDDMASRKFLFEFLSPYGTCDLTVDGLEAVEAFIMALDDGQPYDLAILDIMMPRMDGLKALKAIRSIEADREINESGLVKVIMATALTDTKDVFDALTTGCEAYAAKPVDINKMLKIIRSFGLIE